MCLLCASDRSAVLQPGPRREREVPVEAPAGAGPVKPCVGRGVPPAVAAEGGDTPPPARAHPRLRPCSAVIGRLEVGQLNGGQGERQRLQHQAGACPSGRRRDHRRGRHWGRGQACQKGVERGVAVEGRGRGMSRALIWHHFGWLAEAVPTLPGGCGGVGGGGLGGLPAGGLSCGADGTQRAVGRRRTGRHYRKWHALGGRRAEVVATPQPQP